MMTLPVAIQSGSACFRSKRQELLRGDDGGFSHSTKAVEESAGKGQGET